jgi:hypothetical protein
VRNLEVSSDHCRSMDWICAVIGAWYTWRFLDSCLLMYIFYLMDISITGQFSNCILHCILTTDSSCIVGTQSVDNVTLGLARLCIVQTSKLHLAVDVRCSLPVLALHLAAQPKCHQKPISIRRAGSRASFPFSVKLVRLF